MIEILKPLTDLSIPFAIQRPSENRSELFCHFLGLVVAVEKVQRWSRNNALSTKHEAKAAPEDADLFRPS
jgi:hypothetical protein